MEAIKFGTEQLGFCFSKDSGYLEQIIYNEKQISVHSRLWKVQTAKGWLDIASMERFRFECCGAMLKLYWENAEALVTVTLRTETVSGTSETVSKYDKLRMNINVDLKADNSQCSAGSNAGAHTGINAVNRVQFPIIEGLKFAQEDYLLVTWQNGSLIKNPIDSLLCKGEQIPFWMGRGKYAYENDYPAGLSYQYTTFYSPEEFGYYFATEDEDAYIKSYTYEYNKEQHALDFYITNYPENMGRTTNYCMPYDFVMTLFEGDWQVATRLYRQWAIRQKWCKARLCEKHIPEKVKKTDFWRVNHTNDAVGTRTQEYFDTSVMLRDTLDCNLGLHWYGWNLNEEHDWDTPDYFNDEVRAMGWPEQLKEWNKRFDEAGIVKIPYTNARLWERTTKSWEEYHAEAAAIKGENGEVAHEPWTEAQHLTTVCPSCALWQNKVVDMCKEYVVEEGFDGAYLDQVASFNAMLCFDESHPHPLGGGSWWNASYHRMLSNVRALFGEECIMTTESCCETYIDVFDLFLILDVNFQHSGFNAVMGNGNAVSVPLFSMIYGNYALSYGSICLFRNPLEQFEYNLVRNTLWGMIPSIDGAEMSELVNGREHLAVMKRVVDSFKAHKDVLMYGRLYEVPSCVCKDYESCVGIGGESGSAARISGECEITWSGKNQDIYTFTDIFPAVSAAVWESAAGERYLFAYNYSDKAMIAKVCGRTLEERTITVAGKSFYWEQLA